MSERALEIRVTADVDTVLRSYRRYVREHCGDEVGERFCENFGCGSIVQLLDVADALRDRLTAYEELETAAGDYFGALEEYESKGFKTFDEGQKIAAKADDAEHRLRTALSRLDREEGDGRPRD